jgi:hypothetical protein
MKKKNLFGYTFFSQIYNLFLLTYNLVKFFILIYLNYWLEKKFKYIIISY